MEPLLARRAIVTGANGFVGCALARRIGGHEALQLGSPDWSGQVGRASFEGASVFHLAARVHEAGGNDADFERDNVEKTRVLAEAAGAAGAASFVFLSTAKVNGEETPSGPFRPTDAPAPVGAYAQSKWAAERSLAGVAQRTGLAVTVVRSPLVVGPGARGNLAALLRLADSPWPLPFGALENRRTMVHVDDLAELLVVCAVRAQARGQVFFAGHEEPVSTRRVVSAMRRTLGRPARLVPVPAGMIDALARLSGKQERIRPLTRSLELDVSGTFRSLGWRAATPIDAAIEEMSRAFRSES